MRIIGYNSQRDNFDFSGKFHGWQQCFSTSAWMFMSFWSDKIAFNDDKALAKYVDDVSDAVGEPGTGEAVKKDHHEIVGNSAYWWVVQKVGIETKLNASGIQGQCIYQDNATYDDIYKYLKNGPVIIGTDKLAGLPEGHIILGVDQADGGLIINDPYGDANSFYKNMNGAEVLYPRPLLEPHLSGHILYWSE
jgi:hypothetical protein